MLEWFHMWDNLTDVTDFVFHHSHQWSCALHSKEQLSSWFSQVTLRSHVYMGYLWMEKILNLYSASSHHSMLLCCSLTLGFAHQRDLRCTVWDQGAQERLEGRSDSRLRVIWRAEGGEECKLGYVGCIRMWFWSCSLYHFLPRGREKLNEDEEYWTLRLCWKKKKKSKNLVYYLLCTEIHRTYSHHIYISWFWYAERRNGNNVNLPYYL